MVTQSEARQERAVAALEAASRVFAEKGTNTTSMEVLRMADRMFDWLEEKR